jgi:hypothetical protein
VLLADHFARMKKLLLVLLTSFLSIAVHGQHKLNYVQNIGNTAVISFPDTPRVSTLDKGFSYDVNENGILYTASSYTVATGALNFLFKNAEDSFYQGVLIGFIKSIHGKILYKKDIVVDGIKGIEYEGRGTIDSTIYYMFYRSFYTNKKLVSHGVWFRRPVPRNDERINSFFSTFKFTGKADQTSLLSGKGPGIKGFVYAFAIVSIIIIIIGSIAFIFKKSQQKTKK